ncbi:MAG: hypothetical protein GW893_05985 [Armatimonadetes bacterium]|nr:hypothetical protein [Armatimonadota bacterium]PIY47848.1 MAG: hypothetical protein COZ05_04530 [Armatimonadetes bacterium CG_4_10_14_3_um_filter_59_10]
MIEKAQHIIHRVKGLHPLFSDGPICGEFLGLPFGTPEIGLLGGDPKSLKDNDLRRHTVPGPSQLSQGFLYGRLLLRWDVYYKARALPVAAVQDNGLRGRG